MTDAVIQIALPGSPKAGARSRSEDSSAADRGFAQTLREDETGKAASRRKGTANVEKSSWVDARARLSAALAEPSRFTGRTFAGSDRIHDSRDASAPDQDSEADTPDNGGDPFRQPEVLETDLRAVVALPTLPPETPATLIPRVVPKSAPGDTGAAEPQTEGELPLHDDKQARHLVVTNADETAGVPRSPAGLGGSLDALPLAPADDRQQPAETARLLTEVSSKVDPQMAPDARPGAQGSGLKASVVAAQTIPAPAPANVTTSLFIEMLKTESGVPAPAAHTADVVDHAQPRTPWVQTLKVQLHPAELGPVTASLRLAGEQLEVDIRVESTEAYHRLHKDADIIVKAFRALGYEIDQVSIQQPSPSQPGQRSDSGIGGSPNPFRDSSSSHPGSSGGGGQGLGGHEFGTDGNGTERTDAELPANDIRPARGLYI
jgi:chemotaxis protein MotD